MCCDGNHAGSPPTHRIEDGQEIDRSPRRRLPKEEFLRARKTRSADSVSCAYDCPAARIVDAPTRDRAVGAGAAKPAPEWPGSSSTNCSRFSGLGRVSPDE